MPSPDAPDPAGAPDDEFIRKPKWRTRTTSGRRGIAVAVTFTLIVAAGLFVMVLIMVGLDLVGAPGWLVALPWVVPTAGALVWAVARPGPAVLTDDDDDTWTGYSVRSVMVGRNTARSRALRAITAVLFGAPLVWSFVVLAIAELAGAF